MCPRWSRVGSTSVRAYVSVVALLVVTLSLQVQDLLREHGAPPTRQTDIVTVDACDVPFLLVRERVGHVLGEHDHEHGIR